MNNYLTYSQLQGNQPLNNKSMDKTSHYEKEKRLSVDNQI